MSEMATPVTEEGKLLSESLSTVKIQVQQVKRHLVSFAAQLKVSAGGALTNLSGLIY